MKKIRPSLVLALVVLAGCAKRVEQPASAAAVVFHALPAPAWSLKDVDGNPVTAEQFTGKVLVIDFWATWCAPCLEEIPGYIALQKKYADEGVVFIGISLDQQGSAVVKRFIEKNGVPYPIVMGDESIMEAFGGVESIPTTFIVDRAGMIRDRKVGSEPTADFEKRLRAVLQ